MNAKLFLYIGTLLFVVFAHIGLTYESEKTEYEVEIINQRYSRVKSLSTGVTYFCEHEKIHEVLMKDNL